MFVLEKVVSNRRGFRMTKTFAFYQAELARLQSGLEVLSGREDDKSVGALRDDFIDEITALANEIVDLRCRDLKELRAKMLFVREFCEPTDIDGALVLSVCRDIEAILFSEEKAKQLWTAAKYARDK